MDVDLVRQAQQGDTESFRSLVYGCADRLYAIAYRILRDPDLAEDALQQALIALWKDLPGLRDPARFGGWSYRLVVHATYREARRERRWTAQVRQITSEPGVDDTVAGVIDRDEIEQLFRHLTPEHRAVLVLHYFVGQPISEVAETLGIPTGTAGSRLHYALRHLHAAYEADVRDATAWRTTA
jgi:RNA polymerase sigma-70 factor, ECF subfamily